MTPHEPLDIADALLRGMLLALLGLLAWQLGRAGARRVNPANRAKQSVGRCGAALCLGLMLQVLSDMPLLNARLPRTALAPLVAVAVGNAVLFWLFVRAVFDDGFRLRPRHGLLWAAAAALGGLNCGFVAGSQTVLAPLALGLQRAVPLAAAVASTAVMALHWQADLVEPRRRLRAWLVLGGIAYALLMLLVRMQGGGGQLPPLAALGDGLALLALTGLAASQLLRLEPGALGADPPLQTALPGPALPRPTPDIAPPVLDAAADAEPATDPDDPADLALATALQQAMADGQVYRREDLSVATLAAHLGVPAYRLRRVIHQRLGHRNFNAFVNAWRLDQARAALADPQRRDEAVLSIALDAGFQSIGPFNRAFKAATGLTPSEFRRRADFHNRPAEIIAPIRAR
ncbi:MAG: helix-turn-helix transcriptional regulator [Burkholderiaceae bacterium]|nr:helix-turn-helix transcriptional regulator [Burkholderiaceae bacterium]